MSRIKVLLFILVIASGVTNFIVKQNVQGLDDQLSVVRKQAVAEQKKIHELTADWTYLNQPQLLTDLNNKYVHLQGMSPKQVISGVETIALRPPPAPEPEPQVAAVLDPPPAAQPIPATGTPPRVLPVAATIAANTSRPAIVPVAATTPVAPRPQPAPARPASLDGLFAQVAGDR